MKKIKRLLFSLLFFYLVYGVFISQYDISVISHELNPSHPDPYYDYSGVMNVHTVKSSGSGSFEEIVAAAQKSNLDFIFITDLNNFTPEKEKEKYYNRLLVFVDGEYSYLDSRFLVYGRQDYSNLGSYSQVQVMFSDYLSREEKSLDEGQFVLAHPFKQGYHWSGKYPVGIDGIEVLNLKSIWQQAWIYSKASFLWSILIYPFNPELALVRLFPNPKKEIDLWDRLNQKSEKKVFGFAGSDAEAKIKFPKEGGANVPSYETIFNIVRTHVLLPSELTGLAQKDSENIKSALKSGRFYVSLDKVGSPRGFNALLTQGADNIFPMGSTVKWDKRLKTSINVTLPQKPLYTFDTVIFKDGKEVTSEGSNETEYIITEPGVYRVMIRVIPTFPLPDGKKWVPWIFANPFFVRN